MPSKETKALMLRKGLLAALFEVALLLSLTIMSEWKLTNGVSASNMIASYYFQRGERVLAA